MLAKSAFSIPGKRELSLGQRGVLGFNKVEKRVGTPGHGCSGTKPLLVSRHFAAMVLGSRYFGAGEAV